MSFEQQQIDWSVMSKTWTLRRIICSLVPWPLVFYLLKDTLHEHPQLAWPALALLGFFIVWAVQIQEEKVKTLVNTWVANAKQQASDMLKNYICSLGFLWSAISSFSGLSTVSTAVRDFKAARYVDCLLISASALLPGWLRLIPKLVLWFRAGKEGYEQTKSVISENICAKLWNPKNWVRLLLLLGGFDYALYYFRDNFAQTWWGVLILQLYVIYIISTSALLVVQVAAWLSYGASYVWPETYVPPPPPTLFEKIYSSATGFVFQTGKVLLTSLAGTVAFYEYQNIKSWRVVPCVVGIILAVVGFGCAYITFSACFAEIQQVAFSNCFLTCCTLKGKAGSSQLLVWIVTLLGFIIFH